MKILQDTAHILVLIMFFLGLSMTMFFSDPPHPGITYRTRSNTNNFLAMHKRAFVVLLPPAVNPSELSSGVLQTKCAYVEGEPFMNSRKHPVRYFYILLRIDSRSWV